MRRTLLVSQDKQFGTKYMLPKLQKNGPWSCHLSKAFLMIGILTSPPRFQGGQSSFLWPAIKYASAIDPQDTWLRLRSSWTTLDAHQKTVLSDDFGMGIPALYLLENHGFDSFADTSFLLRYLGRNVTKINVKPKRGPAKLPDFICLDSKGELHILECKGSQSRTYLSTALQSGIEQKNNLSRTKYIKSSMVAGVFVPQFTDRKPAELIFIDPEPEDVVALLSIGTKAGVANGVRRIAFCKTLVAAGLVQLATVLEGSPISSSDRPSARSLVNREVEAGGYEKQDGDWVKRVSFLSQEPDPNIESSVGWDSADASIASLYVNQLTISLPETILKILDSVWSNDKGLDERQLDLILKELYVENLSSTSRSIRERDSSGTVGEVRRNVSSAWKESKEDDKGAHLITPTGLRFELTRNRF
jgi:hypothetical protein